MRIRPDGTKKTKRRLARLGYACYMVGSAKAAILLAEEKSGGRKAAGQAADALPEAAGKNAEVLAEATGQAGTFADQEAYDAAFAEAMGYLTEPSRWRRRRVRSSVIIIRWRTYTGAERISDG